MNLASTVQRTTSHLRDEQRAQERLLSILEAQEEAVRSGDTPGVLEANRRWAEELRSGVGRERERRELLRSLGAHFGADPAALTLTSVIERLGQHAGELPQARAALRDAAGRVLRASRRLSSVARHHRGVVEEVLSLLAPDTDAADGGGRGSLVHVEA